MADIAYPNPPIAVDDIGTGYPDGRLRVAKDNPAFPGELNWVMDLSAANHPYASDTAITGATLSPTSEKTEIIFDSSLADTHAEGTLITDPFDASSLNLNDGTVDKQIVQIHRDGPFVAAINATLEGGLTGIEIHTDHEIGRLQWDATGGFWKDLTNDRADAVAPADPVVDTVMSASSTNAVENQAIVNTLASDTGTLTLNGGVF